MKKLLIISALITNSVFASEVPITIDSGTYKVPVLLNNHFTLDFIVDSGASAVLIPEDVISTLIRGGTISEDDFLEEQEFIQADGSKIKRQTINIKKLQVGDEILYNIKAIIGNQESSLLLGQSFLKNFSSWSIDNKNSLLVLGEHLDDSTNEQAKPKSVAWIKEVGYGIILIVSDVPCKDNNLITKGYQFSAHSFIPKNRLKSPDDAYTIIDELALTTQGCWSPKMHKAFWHRKHDGKEWEEDIRVDDTWIKEIKK